MPLVTSSRKASESSVTGMQQVPLLAFLMPGRMWHRNPASAARQDGDQQEQWPPGQGQCQARAVPYRGGARTYTTRPVMWLGHMVPPGSAPRAGYMLDAESADLVCGHRGCPRASLGRPSVGTSAAQASQPGEARGSLGTESVSRSFGAGAASQALVPWSP